MKRTYLLTFPVLALLFLLTQCQKDRDPSVDPSKDCYDPYAQQLPLADGDGIGGVGCLVNGKNWVADQTNDAHPDISAMFADVPNPEVPQALSIAAYQFAAESCIGRLDGRLRLILVSPSGNELKVGEVKNGHEIRIFGDYKNGRGQEYYFWDTTKPHHFELTHLDIPNKTAAGIFNFSAI